MITANQLVAHAIGDYLLQSDWMANEKTKSTSVALIHAFTYALPFILLTDSVWALAAIVSTHAIIDHYRLARYIVFAKNFFAPRYMVTLNPECKKRYPRWEECKGTGYPDTRPAWMAVWLMIIADNILHVLINGAAIKWL